ncbi:MAG: hypothetical protein OXG15_12520 [Gammaproteobacteria bacterium]|nr:hypothetical protein [Gammaproteobacteria bacterium]
MRGVLILRPTSDVGLIDLDRSEHETVSVTREGYTNAMSWVPGGFLTDPEITLQLGAGNAPQTHEH